MLEIKLKGKLMEVKDNLQDQIDRDLWGEGFNFELFDITDWMSALDMLDDSYIELH